MSKIEQLIGDIEEYIAGCKSQPFTNNQKLIVDRDEIEELLAELRMRTPEEIKRYQKIISNQDSIISTAKTEAEQITSRARAEADAILAHAREHSQAVLEETNRQKEELVSEHEIMQQAYNQAEEIIESANAQAQLAVNAAAADAESIREAAIAYTDEMLAALQELVSTTLDGTVTNFHSLINVLQQANDTITENRRELYPEPEPEIVPDGEQPAAAARADGEVIADMLG